MVRTYTLVQARKDGLVIAFRILFSSDSLSLLPSSYITNTYEINVLLSDRLDHFLLFYVSKKTKQKKVIC